MPIYEKIVDTGKGPQLFTPTEQLIAPDLLVFKAGGVYWVEAKHKTAFSWYRKDERWVTGIDRRHYRHYLKVNAETPWRVWLLFFHEGGKAKDSPDASPSGLFGNSIQFLAANVNHQSDKWGNSGMVYWAKEKLQKMASLEEIQKNKLVFDLEAESGRM
jgi:hypothetical protein